MPLSMLNLGEEGCIKKVNGKTEIKQFLENLGFVSGTKVAIVSKANENLIVNVKNTRVAIGKDMANKILVWKI